jgi:membrane-associated phospholipid phosphatase
MSVAWFDVVLVALGLTLTAFAVHAARGTSIPGWEQRVFRAVNGWPDWLLYVLWLPMQLGNLVVGALWGFAAAWSLGSWEIAVATAVAVPLKFVGERAIRRQLAGFLTVRQRPGTSMPGARRRGGDVPGSGPSFPSGHVIMVATIGLVIAEGIWPTWSWAPLLAIIAVMVGRVYVGAHNPLDVVCGLGVGMVAGGALGVIGVIG